MKEQPQAPLSVSKLTQEIRRNLEERYEWVQVRGEISNFKKAPSGHAYFSLKDDQAVLACVAWRSTVSRWSGLKLKDGDEVIAGGKITVYPPRGQYQLVVSAIRLSGMGALQQRFELLKQKLANEGLFDSERKRPIPTIPQRIAVITSSEGAALQDFLKILRSRRCSTQVVICPTLVQGTEAAGQIANRIEQVNAMGGFDLLVLCRGGGSLEDLWSFNEEIVARAIADSKIPVISGVGHEIDFTIADFVADQRASTPTAAAHLICNGFDEKRSELHLRIDRFRRILIPRIEREKHRLLEARRALKRYHPAMQLAFHRRRLDEILMRLVRMAKKAHQDQKQVLQDHSQRFVRDMQHARETFRSNLQRRKDLLQSYDPTRILNRGYAICRKPGGPPLLDSRTIQSGDLVDIQLAHGAFQSEITQVQNEE